jgi:hypothetical protein
MAAENKSCHKSAIIAKLKFNAYDKFAPMGHTSSVPIGRFGNSIDS